MDPLRGTPKKVPQKGPPIAGLSSPCGVTSKAWMRPRLVPTSRRLPKARGWRLASKLCWGLGLTKLLGCVEILFQVS